MGGIAFPGLGWQHERLRGAVRWCGTLWLRAGWLSIREGMAHGQRVRRNDGEVVPESRERGHNGQRANMSSSQKKAGRDRRLAETHRSMHPDNPFNAPCWTERRFNLGGPNRPFLAGACV